MSELKDISELCMKLGEGIAQSVLALHEGLERCAVLVENSAKKEFGHLQPAVGPFQAWDELTEYTKNEKDRLAANGQLAVALNADYSPLQRTLTMQESISHEVNGLEAVIGSTDQKMFYHELGTVGMAPRPVLGPALYKNKKKIQLILAGAVVTGFFSPHGKQTDLTGDYNMEIK